MVDDPGDVFADDGEVPTLGGVKLDVTEVDRPYFDLSAKGDGAYQVWAEADADTGVGWALTLETSGGYTGDADKLQWLLGEITVASGQLVSVDWEWAGNIIVQKDLARAAKLTPASMVMPTASSVTVTWHAGSLFHSSPEGIGHRPVMLGASSLYTEPKPEMELTGGGPWEIWTQYETNERGHPTTDPVLQEGDPGGEQAWIPSVDGAGGQNGYINQHIGTVSIVGGKPLFQPVNPILIADWDWDIYHVGSGAKPIKELDAGNTRMEVRTHVAESGSGLTVTEKADEIEHGISAYGVQAAHPWRVTGRDDGTCDIAAGFLLGYYFDFAAAAAAAHNATPVDYDEGLVDTAEDIVLGPGGEYAGGNHAVSGTQYIYAEADRQPDTSQDEYAEAKYLAELAGDSPDSHIETTVELYDETSPEPGSPKTNAISIVLSSTAPASYSPTSGKFAVCIAKVTNTAGTVAVDKQYVTDNPTVFVPVPRLYITSGENPTTTPPV